MNNSNYDAIIIGAGHNGLTAAAYLAKSGLRVKVLERRSVVGGCCVTQEIDPTLAPGNRVSTCSYIASMLRPEVIRDLNLVNYGLKMVPCDPLVQAAFTDGDIVSWWNDRHRLDRELERIAPGEAEHFHLVHGELKNLARYLQPYFLEPPPDIMAKGWAGIIEKYRLWKRFHRINGAEISSMVSLLTGSLGDFLDKNFKSEKLKRLILSNSLYGKHGGPYQPGTAVGLLFHLLSGGEGEDQGWSGHVMGGMGAITQAMAQSCKDSGVEIETDTAVAEILIRDGVAMGVALENGTQLMARVILSNADPKRTFLSLTSPEHLDSTFRQQIEGIKMNGPCAKVNFVLSEEPAVSGMPTDATPSERTFFTLIPTLEEAEKCYAIASSGEIPTNLWIDCVVPSLVDPSLATNGNHILTCFVQFLPYSLNEGSWNEKREYLGDLVQNKIAEYSPNVQGSVIARQVLTPLDLESTFGITEGNIFHGDLGLDQLFFMRPVPGCSQYVSPVKNLYLCGAGTHPGGGVTGAPGYNASHRVIRDFKNNSIHQV